MAPAATAVGFQAAWFTGLSLFNPALPPATHTLSAAISLILKPSNHSIYLASTAVVSLTAVRLDPNPRKGFSRVHASSACSTGPAAGAVDGLVVA